VTAMAALTAGMDRPGATADLGPGGPLAARTTGPAGGDRSAVSDGTRTVRSWPLLVLAAPAAAEVWSGWVGIAQKTGFGLVSPLPGIWPSLYLDTYHPARRGGGVCRVRAARLAERRAAGQRPDPPVCQVVRDLLALGMAGQVAYHLLAQAGAARAPWPVTTIVSCLPVLVLAMGTTLAHMLRADAGITADAPDQETGGPVVSRSPAWSAEDQLGAVQGQAAPPAPQTGTGPSIGTLKCPTQDHGIRAATATPSGIGQARVAASRLAATGRPVSRRALRSEGIRGSNWTLNALARTINAELAATADRPARPGSAAARA
jgi:hypothetical protein